MKGIDWNKECVVLEARRDNGREGDDKAVSLDSRSICYVRVRKFKRM